MRKCLGSRGELYDLLLFDHLKVNSPSISGISSGSFANEFNNQLNGFVQGEKKKLNGSA